MRLVIIESPFAGKIERNREYLKDAIADSLGRDEAPFASHAMYPGSLDDYIQEQRKLGIEAGYAWWEKAECIVFYADLGFSPGMQAALARVKVLNLTYEIRKIL